MSKAIHQARLLAFYNSVSSRYAIELLFNPYFRVWRDPDPNQRNVSTIYAGSRNQISLQSARWLGENVAVVHARFVLTAPTGPLAGRHKATLSTVMLRTGET